MSYKWILFDIDNTLLDFTNASIQSFYRTLENHGIQCDTAMHNIYRAINAKVWEDFENKKIDAIQLRTLRFEKFFRAANISPCTPETFSVEYLDNVIAFSECYPGVVPLLEELKGKYRMSIITNGLKEVQRPRLRKLELEKYFESIIVSDEIGVAKPERAFFQYTYDSISTPPNKDEILVVGDSVNSDIKGGINFGVKTCWVNPSGKTVNHIHPDYEIKNILEIRELL